ncbi:MAG TPA: XRE family transcriptional regulator, partial [Solirubrobacteraceae bacterium]|nr:XRE family transcriptional regulator [Solirubrobacteraceae bacterium]
QRVISQLGAIIERVLQERQLSQSELARIAGMQQPDLNALIRGRTEHIPTVTTLRRLARALGTPLRVDIEPDGAVSIRQQGMPQRPESLEHYSAAAGAS